MMDEPEQPPIPIIATVTHSISARLGLLLVVLFGVALAFSGVWAPLLVPKPEAKHTLRYTNADPAFPVRNKGGIRPGEIIEMEVAACNASVAPLGVSIRDRALHKATAEGEKLPYFFDDIHGTWQPGCSNGPLLSQAHRVPLDVAPGTYFLSGTTVPDDESAPLDWRSEPFLVVAT